jgi:hypothetical protein
VLRTLSVAVRLKAAMASCHLRPMDFQARMYVCENPACGGRRLDLNLGARIHSWNAPNLSSRPSHRSLLRGYENHWIFIVGLLPAGR